MRILRYRYKHLSHWGVLEGKTKVRRLKAPPFPDINPGKEILDYSKLQILPPVKPSKIVLVGLNYKKHAEELGMDIPDNPVIFFKPVTTLIADKDDIIYPKALDRVDYEAELALVIKKKAKYVKIKEAEDYILGYTCLNDITARNIQKQETQWSRAKSYDTFCPVGPWIETEVNPKDLKIESYLNGCLKQRSRTSDFIFPVSYIVSFVTSIMTLNPGDIISTGTPEGIGPMDSGDKIEVVIEGVGRLINKVVREDNLGIRS
jgi:2-keto-4-pentenoate hydratase/2-oxohepta-3-ene-1,7-dioic acid hydratase in catechol pathway